MKILPNTHISPDTAFLVDDYPYGFRLRCKIRYWLDSGSKGTRLVSQTTNPKIGGWNKPKYSTYCKFGGAMFLDENNHVQWSGVHEYMDLAEIKKWIETFISGVPESMMETVNNWMKVKEIYETKIKQHMSWTIK